MSGSRRRGSRGPSPLMSWTSWVTTRCRSRGLSSGTPASLVSRKINSWEARVWLSSPAIFVMSRDLTMVGWIFATTSEIESSAPGALGGGRRAARAGSAGGGERGAAGAPEGPASGGGAPGPGGAGRVRRPKAREGIAADYRVRGRLCRSARKHLSASDSLMTTLSLADARWTPNTHGLRRRRPDVAKACSELRRCTLKVVQSVASARPQHWGERKIQSLAPMKLRHRGRRHGRSVAAFAITAETRELSPSPAAGSGTMRVLPIFGDFGTDSTPDAPEPQPIVRGRNPPPSRRYARAPGMPDRLRDAARAVLVNRPARRAPTDPEARCPPGRPIPGGSGRYSRRQRRPRPRGQHEPPAREAPAFAIPRDRRRFGNVSRTDRHSPNTRPAASTTCR